MLQACRIPDLSTCFLPAVLAPTLLVSAFLCSRDWFKGYMASHMGKDMRARVRDTWNESGGGGNLSGVRAAEVLRALNEASKGEAASS